MFSFCEHIRDILMYFFVCVYMWEVGVCALGCMWNSENNFGCYFSEIGYIYFVLFVCYNWFVCIETESLDDMKLANKGRLTRQ